MASPAKRITVDRIKNARTVRRALITFKDKNYSVFLLDDDPDFCQEMTYLLEDVVQFSAFTEPDLLLSALKSAQPDMILVDLNLNKEKKMGLMWLAKSCLPGSHLFCVVMLLPEPMPARSCHRPTAQVSMIT